MYLKRLELQGFKSFREKTRLEFRQGVTAVVGPNGSGKSNISDAVRWVLGELNAKALRGDKMEDVIFAGTKNRSPLNSAEVSLVMDNSDSKLNMNCSDIKITRRIYRSGESEYLINGAKCRLKDIYELFMDTGVGRAGYSIIGQGKIDEVLSSKSEDRRAVFEEAAGIVKMKKSKEDTEKKLNNALNDLQAAEITMSELESRLEPSRRQSEKAKKYFDISSKLKNVRTELFAHNYEITLKNIKECEDYIAEAQKNAENENNLKSECEAERNIIKKELSENETNIENINKEVNSASKLKQEKENSIRIIRQKALFGQREIKRLAKEIEKGKDIIIRCKNDISIKKASLESEYGELEALKGSIKALNEKNKDISKAFEAMEENEKIFNSKISSKRSSLLNLRSEQQILAQKLDDNIENISLIKENSCVLKSRRDELKMHLKALEISKQDCVSKKEELQKQYDAINQKAAKSREKFDALMLKKNETEILFTNINSRYTVLSEIENNYGGYNNAAKTILINKDKFSGIFGSVAELISTEEEYETAVEAVIGSSMQNIITDNEHSAYKAIEYLEKEKKGRATFMPLSSIKPRKFLRPEALNEKNVIGTADSLVYSDEKYKNAVSNMLGGILVVRSAEDASSICKKYNYAFKAVCLDGKVFNAGGSVTGGSLSKSVQIFSRNREIRNLKKQLGEYGAALNALNKDIGKLSEESKKIENETQLCSRSINNISQNFIRITSEYEKTSSELKFASEEERKDKETLERLLSEQGELKNKIYDNSLEIKTLEKEIRSIEEEFAEYKNEIKSSRSKKEKQLNEMNELKIKINNTENNINNARSDINKLQANIAEKEANGIVLSEAIENERNKNIRYGSEVDSLEKEIELSERTSVSLIEKKELLQEERKNLKQKSEELSSRILNHTAAEERYSGERQRLTERKANLEEKNNILSGDMQEKYKISYEQAVLLPKSGKAPSELKREKDGFERALSALGAVNPNAVEEYEEIKKRYEFSVGQRNDILDAVNDLKDIINNLVKDMKKRFCEQFERINKSFCSVFNKMFGGKSYASVRLTNKEDVLSSGIEITAEPDGKDTKKLSLLSGGERALTAIALLFGIINLKPSPFCILDEIEAALDDVNVLRFANYLSEISHQNQFIVITHKQGTMQAADLLYGVTMEEQGISKIVSVNFKK